MNPLLQWDAFCSALSPGLAALLDDCKTCIELAASSAGGPIHRHDSAPSDELKDAPLLHHKLRWLARIATNFVLLGIEPAAMSKLKGSKTMEVLLDINSRFVRGHRKALAKALAQACQGCGGAAAVEWLETEVVPAVPGNTVAKMIPMAVALAAISSANQVSSFNAPRTDPASRVTELEAATASLQAEVAIFLQARVARAAARVGIVDDVATGMISTHPIAFNGSSIQSGALGSAECWEALLFCKTRFKASDTDGRSALDALMALGGSLQLLKGQKMALLEKACRGLTVTATRYRHQQLLGRLASLKQVVEALVSDSGAQLVAELFRTEADAWHMIFPQHFINMVFPRSEVVDATTGKPANGTHANRVAGITDALNTWRGRDQLLGYASRHSRDPVVMANLRLFAERLTLSEGDAAADRYSTQGERGEHLAAVFGCLGHEGLQEKWSARVPSTSFAEFQRRGGVDISASLCGGTVEERVAAAANQVRAPLLVSLMVDKHVGDATTWLPKCIQELADPSVSGSRQPRCPPPPLPTDATAAAVAVADDANNTTVAARQQQQLTSQLDTMLVELLLFDPAAVAAASGVPEEALADQEENVNKVVEQLKALIKDDNDLAMRWGQFLNDVQDIAKSLKRSIVAIDDYNEWQVGITDDANVLFMLGTDVAGSCQHATGSPTLNKCLMSYVLDGKTKAAVISRPGTRPGEAGKPVTIGRCIVRLVLHSGGPALLVSRFYGGSKYRSENARGMFGRAIKRLCSEEAARLGVGLVHPGDPGNVVSLGGVGPEYVDECDGVKIKMDGKWELSLEGGPE